MKITFFDSKQFDRDTFAAANTKNHELIFVNNRFNEDSIKLAKGSDAICTFVNCDVNEKQINELKEMGIKYIFQRSAGYNNVSLETADKAGIKVFRVPAYSPEAVAEHAMTLITTLNRNIHIAYNRTRDKNFALQGLQGDTIHGMTIGVLGAGRIGQSFIKIAKGYGAKVIVFDEYAQKNFPKTADDLGFTYVSKNEVFSKSDYISLHLPLFDSTKYIVNKDTLKLMKKNAIIVNTSRGGLINTSDLLDFLDKGLIRGAGLDVYENEQGIFFYDKSNELVPDHLLTRIRAHRNMILTSHQAYFTNLALRQIAETTMSNVELAINKEDGNTRLILQKDGKVLNG